LARQSADVFRRFMRPQGAPRGLLAYYILNRISKSPVHGYEMLQDIGSKTEGAWRPGAGSIYPILKKFVADGYIRSDAVRGLPTAQKVYRITEKGEKTLKEVRERYSEMGKNWGSMRRIFLDLMAPEHLSRFLIDGTKAQFDIWQEAFESRTGSISDREAEYILREYSIMLERQLGWVNEELAGTKRAVQARS